MNTNEQTTQENTTVSEVDVNLDDLFGMPGAENVMLPENGVKEEEEKKSLFTKEVKTDYEFLDSKTGVTSKPDTEEQTITKAEVEETIAELDNLISQEEDAGNVGRPKVDKSGLYELASKMIEEGSLFEFDDDKPLEEYTTKDFRELFEANFQEKERKIKEEAPKDFFNALPDELKTAAKYVADGGQDLKGLFRTLAQVEEVFELDPEDENHQAEIARQYLYATNFGTPEEIEAEIEDWADVDKLGQKAKQFKPKLDRMQEEIVSRKLAEQETKKEQQMQAAKQYTDNVFNTLSAGELSGIKLDKKLQNMLYSGLVQPAYPSISGKPTNMLGHLLEKYQFVEPRHDLIAEALWLLADPEGYKNKLKDQGTQSATEKTVRMLKTEEAKKIASSLSADDKQEKRRNTTSNRTIPRTGGNNMFKRF
jgi:hypothetical protein